MAFYLPVFKFQIVTFSAVADATRFLSSRLTKPPLADDINPNEDFAAYLKYCLVKPMVCQIFMDMK